MKIKDVSCRQISIRYKDAISVAGQNFTEREAFELIIKSEQGEILSEFSLLPGLHKENYHQGIKLFHNDPSQFKNWSPAYRYPIEVGLFALIHPEFQKGCINVNSYFDPSMNKMPEQLFDGVKIKIARNTLEEDLSILKETSAKNLRLDANRALDSMAFEKILSLNLSVDYFEEPFSKVDDIKNYPEISFALDENLKREDLFELPQVKALIIKPSLIGLAESFELIRKAKKFGKRVVISSTFEGALGHLRLCQIANYSDNFLGYKELHGLGTISLLEKIGPDIRISVLANSVQIHF